MSVSSEGEGVSYAADVKPLFRERDRDSMESHFDLCFYEDVRSAADRILAKLEEGTILAERRGRELQPAVAA